MIGGREPERCRPSSSAAARPASRSATTWPVAASTFVILEANERIGDTWRQRWDSLRLFTPGAVRRARRDAVPRRRATRSRPRTRWPTISRPTPRASSCRCGPGSRVDRRLDATGDGFLVIGRRSCGSRRARRRGDGELPAAAGARRSPRELDPDIVQLHSLDYRNPGQLRPRRRPDRRARATRAPRSPWSSSRGGHPTWMSGRDTGHIPFRIDGPAARLVLVRLVLRVVFHRMLTMRHADRPEGAAGDHVARAGRSSGSSRRTCGRRRRAGAADRRACATACRCWTTAGCSTWRTSSGAPDSSPGSRGSTCRCSASDGEPVHERGVVAGRAGPLLRRPAFPVRHVVHDDPRRRAGRGAYRRDDPAPHGRRQARAPHRLRGGLTARGFGLRPAAVSPGWACPRWTGWKRHHPSRTSPVLYSRAEPIPRASRTSRLPYTFLSHASLRRALSPANHRHARYRITIATHHTRYSRPRLQM